MQVYPRIIASDLSVLIPRAADKSLHSLRIPNN